MNDHKDKNSGQLIWGFALLLAGVGVFFRLSQVMPKISQFVQFSGSIWFIRFCFYLIGIILIGGGLKKIIHYYRPTLSPNEPSADGVSDGQDQHG